MINSSHRKPLLSEILTTHQLRCQVYTPDPYRRDRSVHKTTYGDEPIRGTIHLVGRKHVVLRMVCISPAHYRKWHFSSTQLAGRQTLLEARLRRASNSIISKNAPVSPMTPAYVIQERDCFMRGSGSSFCTTGCFADAEPACFICS